MGLVILFFVIFIITVIVIVKKSPDRMGDDQSYKAKVKDLWCIVKLCQTASYGSPRLELRPAKRSVLMDIAFINVDTVSMSFPLKLKKQQKAKATYLKLFSERNLKVADLDTELIVHLDRKDENLGSLLAQLYKDIFEASDADIVNFNVRTLTSDMIAFLNFKNSDYKFRDSYKFEAPSAKHKGKTVVRVLSERIFTAVYFLLYPPLVILSYKLGGLTGMCWATLIFFGFFVIYNLVYKKQSIVGSALNGSILYCLLLFATLLTQNVFYLQSIPSIMGIASVVMYATLILGIRQPKSEGDIIQKTERPREFNFINSIVVLAGCVLFLLSEWARRNLSFDSWVSFFAYFRIEVTLGMLIIFVPAVYIFYSTAKEDD